MDVPFISSGATSRGHYALVRRVESADTPQLADQHLIAEVQSTRQRLAHPALTLKQCKECLIILLYCSMSTTSDSLATGDLNFALAHAVNMAEAGRTLQDKRIGYLFCMEIMPADHELQLMLVNTLRKDLESSAIPRICLALDTLISSATRDVIPAVQTRLRDLLLHNSPHIRRRAILAFRALARHDLDLLKWISPKFEKRLHDSHTAVLTASLMISTDIVNADSSYCDAIRSRVTQIFLSTWSDDHDPSKKSVLFGAIRALRVLGFPKEHLHVILGIIRRAFRVHAHGILYESFLLLSSLPPDTLISTQTTSRLSPVHNIRSLLTSRDPNEQFLFMSCLKSLNPSLWAGTTSETPGVLEAWEVERVMQLLHSPDILLRRKTLEILHRIDANIVESFYSQSSQSFSSVLSLKDKNELIGRMLDVLEIQCSEDGELYARRVVDLLRAADTSTEKSGPVLEKAVEMILLYIQNSNTLFRIGCVTTLVTSAVDINTTLGATLMVIISALASEYCGRLAVAPIDILHGLAGRLSLYHAAVQEACLLSMLRIVADCEEVSPDVIKSVTDAEQGASQYIRRRCGQFLTLCGEKRRLSEIVSRAQSPSLPAFLEALETHKVASAPPSTVESRSPSTRSPPSLDASSQRPGSSNKLRYAAYELPKKVGRIRRPSGSRWSNSSRSTTFSDAGHELDRTVTAGDLALATGDIQLQLMNDASSKVDDSPNVLPRDVMVDDLTSRTDLITLDSPFISDESAALQGDEVGFERTWDALAKNNARGWCESSIHVVFQHLQALNLGIKVIPIDHPPFEGELKVILSNDVDDPNSDRVVVRLRSSDDESCLWRLRGNNSALQARLQQFFAEG